MLELELVRDLSGKHCTLGVLLGPEGRVCNILEPPWKDNRSNISCIPPGRYIVEYLPRSASGKYKDCYHITGVPGRIGILIHKGNFYTHTLGCLLPGLRVGWMKGIRAVFASAGAMRKLHKVTNRQRFILHVRDNTGRTN